MPNNKQKQRPGESDSKRPNSRARSWYLSRRRARRKMVPRNKSKKRYPSKTLSKRLRSPNPMRLLSLMKLMPRSLPRLRLKCRMSKRSSSWMKSFKS